MNKCIFVGNLTKDFEYRTNNNVSVARGAMALNKGKDREGNDLGADFINLIAFNKTAEVMEKYGKKGKRFAFETHVNTGSYEKDGKRIYTTDFIVDRFEFCDSAIAEKPQEDATGFMPVTDDMEELPFM